MRWLIGKCSGCGCDIVRRYPGNAQDCSMTLSYVCYCSPGLEWMSKFIKDGGVLAIWNEIQI